MTTCGLVTANLFHTLGEVMRRGGSEAAYTTKSRGGAWALSPKGALATACTAATDSRPPAQSLLQPATSSENLDRNSTHSTELQGFVQKAIEMHQGETLTPPKKNGHNAVHLWSPHQELRRFQHAVTANSNSNTVVCGREDNDAPGHMANRVAMFV